MISQEAIKEFKDLFFKEFSIELTDDEALARATIFLAGFKVIYRPIPITEDDSC